MSDSLDKTQPLPQITDDMLNQDTQLISHSRVRQLEPVNVNTNRRQPGTNQPNYQQNFQQSYQPAPPKPPKKDGKGKTVLLLFIAFVVAMFVGLGVSGYISDRNTKQAELKQQQAQSEKNALEASEKQQDLSSRRAQLDRQIKELEAQQKKAQSEADTLRGKSEQKNKDQKDKSGIVKVFDKVTGKEGQEKKEAQEIDQQEKSAADKLAEINESINNAKEAYDEVNRQLDELEALRQKAVKTKADAEKVYNDNKDLIDSVAHYVIKGVTLLQDMMK